MNKPTQFQIKKWFYDSIKLLLKENGFNVGRWQGLQLPVRRESQAVDWVYVDVDSSKQLCFGPAFKHIQVVEHLLLKFTGLTVYEEKPTIKIAYSEPLPKGQSWNIINQSEDIEVVRQGFETAFTEHLLPALNKYEDPANVLKLWDGLTTTEERNGHFQGPDKYIKILIISKLANDFLYEERCNESIQFYQKHIADGLLSAQKWLELCHKVIDYLNKHDTINDL